MFTLDTEPIGLLAGALRRRIRALVEARVAPFAMTPQQFWIFVAAAELPEASLADIAARVRSDLPNASRAMKELLLKGLVVDERPSANRRRARFLLTRKGRVLEPKLLALAKEVRRSVDAGLSARERVAVRRGLRKAIEHLDALLLKDAPGLGK